MEQSHFRMNTSRIINIGRHWCVLALSMSILVHTVSARPQATNDLISEATCDFKALAERRGYGRLAQDSREKAEFDKIVAAAANKRIGVWESYAIYGTLPPPLNTCEKLYLELAPDISARLYAKGNGTGKIIHMPSFSRGRFTDRSIFLGNDNDGLLFLYTIVYGRMYTMLNPNGIQLRIYFRLLPDLRLPEEETACGNGPPTNSPPTIQHSAEPYFQDGWYVCTNLPSGFRHREKETLLYLYLNSHADARPSYCAFPIFYGGGNYYLDFERWRYPDFMDTRQGPFGVYSATESSISFDTPPPSREELSEIRLYGALSLKKPEKTIIHLANELINTEKTFSDLFPKWIEDGPDARKLSFAKTNAPGITANNIRFMLKDKEFWKKDLAEEFIRIFVPGKEKRK